MAEDFELAAAITVNDTSELEGLSADVAPEAGGAGAGAGGGGGDFLSGILERLGGIGRILSTAVAALGVITAVPGLLSGVFRLLEVALLPIGILFQNLLAPLIQRLLRFFATNDIFSKIESFARQVVSAVTNFVSQVQQFTASIDRTLGNLTGGEVGVDTFLTGVTPASAETQESATAGQVTGSLTAFGPAGRLISTLVSELTASAFDDLSSETSKNTSREGGP